MLLPPSPKYQSQLVAPELSSENVTVNGAQPTRGDPLNPLSLSTSAVAVMQNAPTNTRMKAITRIEENNKLRAMLNSFMDFSEALIFV
jgi:hypothetical protein